MFPGLLRAVALSLMLAIDLMPVSSEMIDICASFNYTINTDGVNFNSTTGKDEFDQEGIDFVNQKIDEANVNVNITNYTSILTSGSCDEQPVSPFVSCAVAGATLCAMTDETIDQDLIDRLSLAKVRTFVREFNQSYPNQISITYQYPIPVKGTIVLTFSQANAPVNETALIEELRLNLGAVLAQEGFDLINVIIYLQTAMVASQGTRRRLNEKNVPFDDVGAGDQVTGVQVQGLIYTHCPLPCSEDTLKKTLNSATSENYIKNEMLVNLKEDDPNSFAGVESVAIADDTNGVLNLNVTEILGDATRDIPPFRGEPQEIEEEKVTWWIWVLFGVIMFVIVAGGLFAFWAVHRRNEKRFIQDQYDHFAAATHSASHSQGGGGSVASRSAMAGSVSRKNTNSSAMIRNGSSTRFRGSGDSVAGRSHVSNSSRNSGSAAAPIVATAVPPSTLVVATPHPVSSDTDVPSTPHAVMVE